MWRQRFFCQFVLLFVQVFNDVPKGMMRQKLLMMLVFSGRCKALRSPELRRTAAANGAADTGPDDGGAASGKPGLSIQATTSTTAALFLAPADLHRSAATRDERRERRQLCASDRRHRPVAAARARG